MLNTTTSMKDEIQKFTRVKNKYAQNQSQFRREQTIVTEKIHEGQNKIFQTRIT